MTVDVHMSQTIAIFDCDGTLYSAEFGYGLMQFAAAHGRKGSARFIYVATFIPYVRHKLKLAPRAHLLQQIVKWLTWMIRGWDDELAAAAFDWMVDEYVLPAARPSVVRRLRDHQRQGHYLLLASGQYCETLSRLGRHFGVDGIVGTEIERRDGRLTGKLIPPVITGRDKKARVLAQLASASVDVDWPASYAYGDSISDRHVMEMVGNPVAVHPGEELRRLAVAGGWEILDGD
jgi:HAD superfamily hydrolase (TIGR01490 family)